MFTLEKNKSDMPIAIIRGDTPLDNEIVYMRKQGDEDGSPKKAGRRYAKRGGKIKPKKVRFSKYEEYDDSQAEDDDFEDDDFEDEEEEEENEYTRNLQLDSGKFELLPNTEERQRHNIYVCGRSGSGKSTWIRNYIKNYLKMKKGNPVYVFSALTEDPAFDDLKINRIVLDEDIVNNPIEPAELRDSLCVFDDIDVISDPRIKKAVIELQDKCLEIGRHSALDLCCSSHKICDYRRSRTLLNESSHIVIFPVRGNNLTKYFLDKYSGLDKANIKRIYNSKSRWTTIQINHPGFILQEKELYLPE